MERKILKGKITKIFKDFGFCRLENGISVHFYMNNAYGNIAVGNIVYTTYWETPRGFTGLVTTEPTADLDFKEGDLPNIYKFTHVGKQIVIITDLEKKNIFKVCFTPSGWNRSYTNVNDHTIYLNSNIFKENTIFEFEKKKYRVKKGDRKDRLWSSTSFDYNYIDETIEEEKARKAKEAEEASRKLAEEEARKLAEEEARKAKEAEEASKLITRIKEIGIEFPISINYYYKNSDKFTYSEEYIVIINNKIKTLIWVDPEYDTVVSDNIIKDESEVLKIHPLVQEIIIGQTKFDYISEEEIKVLEKLKKEEINKINESIRLMKEEEEKENKERQEKEKEFEKIKPILSQLEKEIYKIQYSKGWKERICSTIIRYGFKTDSPWGLPRVISNGMVLGSFHYDKDEFMFRFVKEF